ncbi:MAG: tryptophan-rich sensory protein [Synechococcales cyanobacterium T60_A2020_003]|nr:tryptophan-rich sensory protein [Synechococcales cyanobacterium T60_A2020_003]
MISTPSPKSSILMPWLTLAAIVGTFIVNVLSNIYPLNGMSIGELSNTMFADVLITPANYAFAIWGVIYLGLFAFGTYQVAPAQRSNSTLTPIRPWVIAACVAQIVWVYLFLSRLFVGSLVAMIAILVSLIMVYLQCQRAERLTRADRQLMNLPFSIYLGWISVATVVNGAIALYSVGWTGGGLAPAVWTAVMLVVSGAIALVLLCQYRDIAFPGVVIWAAVAIALRQAAIPTIAWTAWGVAIGLGLAIAVSTLIYPTNVPRSRI